MDSVNINLTFNRCLRGTKVKYSINQWSPFMQIFMVSGNLSLDFFYGLEHDILYENTFVICFDNSRKVSKVYNIFHSNYNSPFTAANLLSWTDNCGYLGQVHLVSKHDCLYYYIPSTRLRGLTIPDQSASRLHIK